MLIAKVPGINGGEKGCRNSGNAILAELKKISVNESGKEIDADSLELEEIHLDNSDLIYSDELIRENALEIFEEKSRAIFLGGDHSITYSLGKSFLDYCEEKEKQPCMIIFDAHPNCKIGNSAQSPPLLATPLASDSKNLPREVARPPLNSKNNANKTSTERNEKIPKNTEWLRALIESGFPAKNILLVGMRNSEKEERNFLKETGASVMQMSNFLEDFDETCNTLMEFSKGKELYVSIDVSVLDPAFAPATEFKESGGFTGRELIHIVQRINKIKNLKALDIVEIDEQEDKNRTTIKMGAKILSELL